MGVRAARCRLGCAPRCAARWLPVAAPHIALHAALQYDWVCWLLLPRHEGHERALCCGAERSALLAALAVAFLTLVV